MQIRHWLPTRIALALASLMLAMPPAAEAAPCQPGWVRMSGTSECMPRGAVDCGHGKYCNAGDTCVRDKSANVTIACNPREAVLATLKDERQEQLRNDRRKTERSSKRNQPENAQCNDVRLAPGAWAWGPDCISGQATAPSGHGRPSDRAFIRESIEEAAKYSHNGALTDQLPPVSTAVAPASSPQAPPPGAAAPPAADCAEAETHWKSVAEIGTLAAYQDHLARFPNCAFAPLARARIEALRKK